MRSAKSEGHSRVFAEGIPRIQLDRGHRRAKRLPPIHVDDAKTFEQIKLKVGWSRLSDLSSDGEMMMRRLLVNSDLAGKMRNENNDQYYYW